LFCRFFCFFFSLLSPFFFVFIFVFLHLLVLLFSLPVGNKIGDEGAIAIGKAIEKNGALKRLTLSRMTFFSPCLFYFYVFSMSFFSPVLFFVVLYSLPVGNELGAEGAIAIGKAIEKNGTLKRLMLRSMTFLSPCLFCFYVFSMSFFSPLLYLGLLFFLFHLFL